MALTVTPIPVMGHTNLATGAPIYERAVGASSRGYPKKGEIRNDAPARHCWSCNNRNSWSLTSSSRVRAFHASVAARPLASSRSSALKFLRTSSAGSSVDAKHTRYAQLIDFPIERDTPRTDVASERHDLGGSRIIAYRRALEHECNRLDRFTHVADERLPRPHFAWSEMFCSFCM